jgi:hypothetical protein
MTRSEFLALMKFPVEWDQYGMYPDELFRWQVSAYQQGHEEASEHDRNGAFHWWLRRNPSKQQLEMLLLLARVDPDEALAQDVRAYLRKAQHFDSDLAKIDAELFGGVG